LFDSRESITGIDLGAAGVKLARARAGKGIRRLLNVGLADFPSEGAGSWAEKAGIALRGLLADQGLKPRDLGRVLVAVSGPSVHLRQVEMPVLSETELRSSLRYEARQHLPLENLGEAALDCQVIEGMAREEGSKQSVLMVGAPDSLVQSRIQVLNGAGIDPEVVDVAPLALLNALEGSDPEAMVPGRTVAIADLGHSASTLVFNRRGGAVYSRSVAAIDNGNSGGKELAQAFRETAQFYAQMNERRTIDQLYLTGGGALIEDLSVALADRLKLPVAVLDATRRLAYSPGRGQKLEEAELSAQAPRLAVALGLLFWGDGGV